LGQASIELSVFDPALTNGNALTKTSTESLCLQPFASVTNTMYVVVAVGLAIGFEIDELSNPVDGVH
jgi:hypothetical protein